jgi:hypothetical protein
MLMLIVLPLSTADSKYPEHDELYNNAELSSMRLVKFSHQPLGVQYLLQVVEKWLKRG